MLRPGGRLVAQCGGEGNVAEHARPSPTVATQPQFIDHFEGMTMMWNFANPAETEDSLRNAGFEDISLLARGQAGAAREPV